MKKLDDKCVEPISEPTRLLPHHELTPVELLRQVGVRKLVAATFDATDPSDIYIAVDSAIEQGLFS